MLAGGQSLVPLLKLRFAAPELLVDINNLPAWTTTASTRTARSGSAPCAGTPTSSALDPLRQAADDGRGGAADRRPDRAQPRAPWSARCATPTPRATGPPWVTALGGHVVAQGRPAGARSRSPTSSPARSRRRSRRRDRGRGGDPGAEGHPGRRLPQAGAPGRRLRHRRASRWRSRGRRDVVTRAGIAPDRRRRLDDRRRDAAAGPGRVALTADRSSAADLAAQAAQPRTDHRAAPSTSAHRAHVRRRILEPCRRFSGERRPDMTACSRRSPRSRPTTSRPAGHDHRQRRARRTRRGRAPAAAGPPAAPGLQADRHAHRLRHHQLRGLHGPVRRQAGQELHDARRPGRRPRGHHRRGLAGRASCTRSRRASRTSTACSAASARPG